MKKLFPLLTFAVVIIFIGCSDSGDSPTSSDNNGGGNPADTIVSYASDVRPLFSSYGCLNNGCHSGASVSGGLDLENGSYSVVRNASGDNGPIIVAGNANSSNLYLKLTNSPPFGARMPFGGSQMATTDMNSIRDWINQGALDN